MTMCLGFPGKEEPLEDRGSELSGRIQRAAYIALVLMALMALLAYGADVSSYVRAIKSAGGLSLEITNLEVIDGDDPRALVRFRLRNDSPVEIQVERNFFTLYLNSEQVGSSYSTYLGTDPDVDPAAHRAAQDFDQTLAPGQAVELDFMVHIHPTQMEIVRQAQRSGTMSWHMDINLRVLLLNSRKKSFLNLRARFEE